MAVRIGIDVGGTFTDAVVVDHDTFELIGSIKIPTTHSAAEGVAAGIVAALNRVLEKYDLSPSDVVFIAHGTTQATNALLEGDVETVGIIGLGKGLEGMKVSADTKIPDIELASNRFLRTRHQFVNMDRDFEPNAKAALQRYQDEGVKVAVVSAAYSVDDPSSELAAMAMAEGMDVAATGTHEISKLYGLSTRTRTAVINASILPKMLSTAKLTDQSVRESGIDAPLMIMRCDGGVMSVDEMKKRPILTMLSGPAAGVAGALMYEKVSEGIFLEVGGTSTDISAIHNGKVMVDYAEVGGHKTYVNSLDVRTVGIAGGSMIRIKDGNVSDVGPRSAHIAGLPYLTFADPAVVSDDLEVVLCSPQAGDQADYISLRDGKSGKSYALTLACAANASGYVQPENYAFGNAELARRGFEALARHMNCAVDDLIEQVNAKAASKNSPVVEQLFLDYSLERSQIVLVGGGGGAAAVVPYLAHAMGLKFKIARNAEVISPIGVALAMVRDVVERTIANPTQDDIIAVRQEAYQAALKAGATAESISVVIEVDPKLNVVRGTATGSTEMRTDSRSQEKPDFEEIRRLAAESIPVDPMALNVLASNEHFYVCGAQVKKKKRFSLFSTIKKPVRIVSADGVIRLQTPNAAVACCTVEDCRESIRQCLNRYVEYGDGGERLPETFAIVGARMLDLSQLTSEEQVLSLLEVETAGLSGDTPVLAVFCGDKI